MSSTPPGWYPDGQGGQRWWDGNQWTEHTQPGSGDAPAAPQAPQASSGPSGPGADLPTQIAPNRAASYGGQQPQQPAAPQQPGSPYGAPAGGYGQPGQAPQQFGQQPFGQGYAGQSGGGGGKGKLIAIIGGGIAALVLVVVALFVLFSVLGGGSPEDVAEDYLEATSEFDIERACELVDEKSQEEFFNEYDVDNCGDATDAVEDSGELEELEDVQDDLSTEYEIGDVTEDGDTAEVDFTSTTTYEGDDEALKEAFGEGEEVDGTIFLVKEDGDWKVDGDKSDSPTGF